MSATGRDLMEVFRQRLVQAGAPVWPHCPMCQQQGWTMLSPTVDQPLKEAFPSSYRTIILTCDHCGYFVNLNGYAPAYADLFPDRNCPDCHGIGTRQVKTRQYALGTAGSEPVAGPDYYKVVPCECWDRNERT